MKIKPPVLSQGEEIVLSSQGGINLHLRAGWKLGKIYLTNKRLLFLGPSRVIFETPIQSIKDIKVEKRRYILGDKNALSISYIPVLHSTTDETRIPEFSKIWIIANDLETWRKAISEKARFQLIPSSLSEEEIEIKDYNSPSTLPLAKGERAPELISKETVSKIAKKLDFDAQQILWYLWRKRHARIDELAEAISAPTHMDVLLKIRESINPTAEKLIGSPLLAFERSKIDEETGKKILFSWWFVGKQGPVEAIDKGFLLDVFDEGNHLTLIAEILNTKEEDILIKVEGDKLKLNAITPDNKYQEEISLPCEVKSTISKKYHNNILEIKLIKK